MDRWEKEFEERIREKLSGAPIDFDPAAWEKMEQRLYPATAKDGWLALWWLRTAAAVILLAGAGIWAYTAYFDTAPSGAGSADPLSSVRERVPADTSRYSGTDNDQRPEDNARQRPALTQRPGQSEENGPDEKPALAAREPDPARERGLAETGKHLQEFSIVATPADPAEISGIITTGGLGGRLADSRARLPQVELKAPASRTPAAPRPRTAADEKDKMSLSLGVLAAPDLNGVGGFRNGKAGMNVGLGLGLHFNDRLSLHSGIIYSRKPYNALPSDYHMRYSPQGLVNIAAVCDVIDIPLNLRYTVYRREANSIVLSAGLSSYLMLREQYEYQYDYEPARAYEYKNENRHFMGIGNFGVALERKISDNMSIGVEPFIKVPLTGIGRGDVRLISAGAALRLNVDLRKKPGISINK